VLIEIPDDQIPAQHRDAVLAGRMLLVTVVAVTPEGLPSVVNYSPSDTDSKLLGLAAGLACNSIDGMASRVASCLEMPQRIAFECARLLGQNEGAIADNYSQVRITESGQKTDRNL
jgi:hypothetical protein